MPLTVPSIVPPVSVMVALPPPTSLPVEVTPPDPEQGRKVGFPGKRAARERVGGSRDLATQRAAGLAVAGDAADGAVHPVSVMVA
jgi:hypothetical protein